ncbi:hypothetical protein LguiB_027802 [Lonicera macranthoides]
MEKLRKTEDRVRVLQSRLCKLVQAEDSLSSCSAAAVSTTGKASSPASDKSTS